MATTMTREMLATVTVERGTGMDVGCKRDAYRAAHGMLREIGNGAQRVVYVDDRSRFVYKIATDWYPEANREEFEAFMSGRLSAMGLGMYGSPVALFTVQMANGPVEVLAMPFRSKSANDADPNAQKRFMARGARRLPDMHDANWRVTANGRIKITDLGFGVAR
jgi:hypothetical protein